MYSDLSRHTFRKENLFLPRPWKDYQGHSSTVSHLTHILCHHDKAYVIHQNMFQGSQHLLWLAFLPILWFSHALLKFSFWILLQALISPTLSIAIPYFNITSIFPTVLKKVHSLFISFWASSPHEIAILAISTLVCISFSTYFYIIETLSPLNASLHYLRDIFMAENYDRMTDTISAMTLAIGTIWLTLLFISSCKTSCIFIGVVNGQGLTKLLISWELQISPGNHLTSVAFNFIF